VFLPRNGFIATTPETKSWSKLEQEMQEANPQPLQRFNPRSRSFGIICNRFLHWWFKIPTVS